MSEVTSIISCTPFILKRMRATKALFRPKILTIMNQDRDIKLNTSSFKDMVTNVFFSVARSNKAVFAREVKVASDVSDPYEELDRLVLESRRQIYDFIEPIEKV